MNVQLSHCIHIKYSMSSFPCDRYEMCIFILNFKFACCAVRLVQSNFNNLMHSSSGSHSCYTVLQPVTVSDMFHHFGIFLHSPTEVSHYNLGYSHTYCISMLLVSSLSLTPCVSLFSGALRGQTLQFCTVRLPETSQALSSSG